MWIINHIAQYGKDPDVYSSCKPKQLCLFFHPSNAMGVSREWNDAENVIVWEAFSRDSEDPLRVNTQKANDFR